MVSVFAVCSSIALVSFFVCKIDQLQVPGGWQHHYSSVLSDNNLRLDGVTMSYVWYESYRAVVLETDWTRMHDRIQSAECQIHGRQRVLSEDHGGTPQERQAIANALNGMRTLRTEVADWQSRQASQETDAKTTSEIALSPILRDSVRRD
jgi:hypothetical protein